MIALAIVMLSTLACVVQSEMLGNLCLNPCENTPCANQEFSGEKGSCRIAEFTFALDTCVNETGTVQWDGMVPEKNTTFKAFSLMNRTNASPVELKAFDFRVFDDPLCANESMLFNARVHRIDCGPIHKLTFANGQVFRAVALLDTTDGSNLIHECDSTTLAAWKIVLIVIGCLLALAIIVILIVRKRRQTKAFQPI
jgi:hypothetical protein